jgi:hypothetical protein
VQQAVQDAPGSRPTIPAGFVTPSLRSEVDKTGAGGAERHVAQDSGTKTQQQEPEQTTTREQPARLVSASDGSPVPPPGMSPARDSDQQENRAADHSVSWRGWQQLPASDVSIRIGNHYLGGGTWAHYLGFELAPTSQKAIKVSRIQLEG